MEEPQPGNDQRKPRPDRDGNHIVLRGPRSDRDGNCAPKPGKKPIKRRRRRQKRKQSENKTGGLLLQRYVDESIMIGDNIEVTVVGVSGGKVRLVVNAPRDVVVDRKEIYLEKKAGKEAPVEDEQPEQ